MPEKVSALFRGECLQRRGGRLDQLGLGPRGAAAQMSFEFAEGHFDRIQIRAVRRQIVEGGASFRDGLLDATHAMAGKIVANDQITGMQFTREHLADVGQEHCSIHGTIDEQRRHHSLAAQSRDQRRGAPVTVREAAHTALAAKGSSIEPSESRIESSLIQKDQLPTLPSLLAHPPLASRLASIRTLLLVGVHGFFYN
jgi:hypothetical protein